jgi:hypothetical protein
MRVVRMTIILLPCVACLLFGLPRNLQAQIVIPEVPIRPMELPKTKPPETRAGQPSFDLESKPTLHFDDTATRITSEPYDDQIVLGKAVAGCPLIFLNVSIRSYRLIYQRHYAAVLADEMSPLHQDVCECRLMPGNYQACALKAILANATPVFMPALHETMARGIQVSITDPQEFEKLFSYISSNLPAYSNETAAAFRNGGAGGSDSGTPPPTQPPSESPPPPQLNRADNDQANKCERSSKICISPKDGKVSAEFSIKCKNMPEFTISTDGEASMKLGPIAVSFSPN